MSASESHILTGEQGKRHVCIAVLAHNEETRIGACIESLVSDVEDAPIHVIVNGSSDGTADIARSRASKYPNITVHDWEQGGKSRSWNRFVFDTLEGFADYHVFVDGDAIIEPGSISALVQKLGVVPGGNGVAGLPLNGRQAEYYREIVLKNHQIFGDLYALRGDFLQRMKDKNIRLPNDLVGDDGLIGALVKCDLRSESHWDDNRLTSSERAGFYCEPTSLLRLSTLTNQYARMTNYSVRHFQNLIISDIMRGEGPTALPENLSELYPQYLPNFRPRSSLPNWWFDRLALAKMRQSVS